VPVRARVRAYFGANPAGDDEISATEDLMREHGVLRRALIVYGELASRLQAGRLDFNLRALVDAARLFREFGENYHERVLEEQYVFPEVRKAGGPNEKLVEVLLAQHQRAREITAYLERVGARGKIGNDFLSLSRALAGMSRMYHAHATWEDTWFFQRGGRCNARPGSTSSRRNLKRWSTSSLARMASRTVSSGWRVSRSCSGSRTSTPTLPIASKDLSFLAHFAASTLFLLKGDGPEVCRRDGGRGEDVSRAVGRHLTNHASLDSAHHFPSNRIMLAALCADHGEKQVTGWRDMGAMLRPLPLMDKISCKGNEL
jgi:hemerythrin-like domain-containing protein